MRFPIRHLLSLLPRLLLLFVLVDFSFAVHEGAQNAQAQETAARFFSKHKRDGPSGHTNNWAVLVCASRYWFNYRHMANALGMYRTVKRLGIPDSNIILMLADDAACNSRNRFPGAVYARPGSGRLDLYGENIEVDYRGYEVTVENFIRVLTGRVDPSVPRSKRLLTDDRSNVFVYMTGHGGDEFLKFQDSEEISAHDIADAFEQMWQKRRYNELFFMIDTCQASTMYSKLYSPNILATGSSVLHESSWAHENDADIGVSVIDSYTHYMLQYMESINKTSHATMQDLFNLYDPQVIRSHAHVRDDLFARRLDTTLLTDFFGGVAQAEVDSGNDISLDGSQLDAVLGAAGDSPSVSFSVATENASANFNYESWEDDSMAGMEESSQKSAWGAWASLGVIGALVLLTAIASRG